MKQMKENNFWSNIEKTAIMSKATLLVTLLFNFAINSFQVSFLASSVTQNMDCLISVINALQFVFNFPIMRIVMQANVMSYLNIVIPIVMFDIIDSVPIISDQFEVFDPNDEKIEIRD